MRKITWAAGAALLLALPSAHAQEVTLKVHHFLPAGSAANTGFIQPWCDRIAKDSGGRMKCQIYPSMQLGGTPGQLIDQVKDGVVDIIWTLPGYTAGRFPLSEVFELPFMMTNPEATSKALWDFNTQVAAAEYKDVHPIAYHVHGPGVLPLPASPHPACTPILTVQAFYGAVNALSVARGHNPDVPPHLNKVTETV